MDKLSRRSNLSHIELMKAIDRLPPDLGDAYHSIEMVDVIRNIARRYKLNHEEEWELLGIVYDVILGLLPPPAVETEIKNRVRLEPEEAGFVLGELDAFIFNHIRPALNKVYGLEKASKEAEAKNLPDQNIADPYRESIE